MPEVRRRPISGTTTEARSLRLLLAVLRTETKLVRMRRTLSRKYSPDQPRAPAGQSDGGRWVSDGGAGGDASDRSRGERWASLDAADPGSEAPQRTLLDGGGEVLTLRIRSGRGDWDEQHTVVTPEGESRVFENSGDVQTIRDGQSGEVLSHSTFADEGTASDATVQPAFLPATVPFVVAPALAATIEAGALLFTYLRARPGTFGRQPGRTAFRYDFPANPKNTATKLWIGHVDQSALNGYCPLNPEVQEVTDEATRRLKALHPHLSDSVLGTLIHYDVGETFRARNYPNVRVEYSIDKIHGTGANYGKQNSVRLDLYEYTPNQMVCVYDYKTGRRGLSATRALLLARIAQVHFPNAKGVVIVQVRPN